MNERMKGVIGEGMAVRYLEDHGYTIVARNYHSDSGEVDIIMQDDEKLVFVEVKHWKHMGIDNLEYAINGIKRGRIIDSSKQYIFENPKYANYCIRYDVVLISGSDSRIYHIHNAFSEVG